MVQWTMARLEMDGRWYLRLGHATSPWETAFETNSGAPLAAAVVAAVVVDVGGESGAAAGAEVAEKRARKRWMKISWIRSWFERPSSPQSVLVLRCHDAPFA